MRTTIVYGLHYIDYIQCYLPSAYIAEVKDHKLGKLLKKANVETLESYTIAWENTVHEQLLKTIEILSPENIESYFNQNGRKNSIQKLIQDKEGLKRIQKFVFKYLTSTLELITLHNLPVCLEVEHKIRLEEVRLNITKDRLIPRIKFVRTQLGLKYELSLIYKDNSIKPSEHDVHLLTDLSGWVIIDYKLYKLQEINTAKLLPFMKKESIFIPSRIQEDYFKKFIKDIIGRVDCEVEGFDLLEIDIEPQLELKLIEDLFEGSFILAPKFIYNDIEFWSYDMAKHRVNLTFAPELKVEVYKRSFKIESDWLSNLKQLGLSSKGQYWGLESEDKFEIISWVIRNADDLRKKGIHINPPLVNGKMVSLERYDMDLSFQKRNDWFDVQAVIKVGDESILFAELLEYIANEERFYPLASGRVFIIPMEWMQKYSKISKFSKKTKNGVRVSSTHFTLIDQLEDSSNSQRMYTNPIDHKVFPISKKLNAKLRPYQDRGAQWLINHYENDFGALLADDMGLGKTIQTIALLLHAKDQVQSDSSASQKRQLTLFDSVELSGKKPLCALVILPSSLVYNWREELQKFAPSLMVTEYRGPQRRNILIQEFDVILTTYQTTSRDVDRLKGIDFHLIILDESHYIKNRKSGLFQNINKLSSRHKVSLSGTPIENSLSDLYTQMEFINPDILGSYEFFKKHFQIPIEKGDDESTLDDLNAMLDPFILRRTKEEVLKDLPDLSEYIVYSEMSADQSKIYEEEKSIARNHLLGIGPEDRTYKIHVFNMLLRLRKLCNHASLIKDGPEFDSGKFKDVTAFISNVVKSGNHALVFSSFIGQLDLYVDYCKSQEINYELLTGATKTHEREAAIDRFNSSDESTIFFISLKAGGVGLNLTKANYVAILDPWWNPFAERQAIARAHRMGQNQKVLVSRFITKGSVEEKMLKLQQQKLQVAGGIVDLGSNPEIESSSVDYFFG